MVIFRQLSWFFKKQWKQYFGGVMALILVAICNVIPAKVIGNVVDRISQRSVTAGWLTVEVIIMFVAAVAQYFLRFGWQKLIYGSSYVLERDLRGQLFHHFMRMDPAFYARWRTGDLMAHATNDVESVREVASYGILTMADSLITGGSMIIAMGIFVNWRLTILTLLPLPLLVLLSNKLGNKIHQSYAEAQAAFGDLNNKTQESISGIKVIKSLGEEKADQNDFHKYVTKTLNANRRAYFWDALFNPATTIIMGLSYVIALGSGGFMVSRHSLSVGQLVTMITYLGELVWPLFAIGSLFNILERGRASYDRIDKLLKEQPEWQSGDVHLPVISGQLAVNINHFRFPDSQSPVLYDVHFKVKPGEMLGIVGPTGGGKSTLLRLLIRDYDNYDGTITIGNTEIRDVPHGEYVNDISYVPQTNFLFSTTVKDNLRFSNVKAPQEQVENAAKQSAIHQEIQKFPNQYDTQVGQEGVSLSGGQKQRVAIGRAIMKNSALIILDDPLSAVDAQTATKIEDNLLNDHKRQAIIMSTSRLSSVQRANWIIVMDNGTIVDQGTPDDLAQRPGWYQDTLAMQNRHAQLEEDLNNETKSTK